MHIPYTDVVSSRVVQRGVATERRSGLDRAAFDPAYIGDGGRPLT